LLGIDITLLAGLICFLCTGHTGKAYLPSHGFKIFARQTENKILL